MTESWTGVLTLIALQHLWQGAVVALLAWLVLRLHKRLGADARSWVLLCAFLLAAISPLAVFLPGDSVFPKDAHVMIAPSPAMAAQPVAHASAVRAPQPDAEQRIAPAMIVLGIWLLGFLWSLRRLVGGWYAARRLRDAAVDLQEGDRWSPRAISEGVLVRVSDRIGSPMVVGFVHPCILLPRRLIDELPEATLTRILRHEIAHVRRRDMWTSLFQAVCVAVYWWSPWLRLLGARLDVAREMACDERAAAQSGGATAYAQTLLTCADKVLASGNSHGVLAVGIFDTRAALTQRIEGLLNMERHNRVSGARPIIIACTTVMFASVSLTLLATPRVDPAPSSATQEASHDGDGALLIEAVNARRLDVIRLLVGNGADIDARVRGDGTALIVAAKHGDNEIVEDLIRLGANVDTPSHGDGNPLIAAAAMGHLDVVETLVDAGADVNAIVPADETPLINAARRGHLPVVKYLVEHGADVNLGVTADFGAYRSPLNQASSQAIRDYLGSQGAVPRK